METDLNELAAGARKYCTVILEQAQGSQAATIQYIEQSFYSPGAANGYAACVAQSTVSLQGILICNLIL